MNVCFLKAGDVKLAKKGWYLETTLGSCIAVMIFDKRLKIGGMNHFVLPTSEQAVDDSDRYRYGDAAMIALLKKFKRAGSDPRDLVVKVAGGAAMGSEMNAANSVGRENYKCARQILRKFGLEIESSAVGGFAGRRIRFDTGTGKILIQTTKGKMTGKVLRVLIVDDSKTTRVLLRKMIESDDNLVVAGEANDPVEAMKIIESEPIDVITLDVNMPKMDGITYLRDHFKHNKIPTVLVNEYDGGNVNQVFEAMSFGAVEHFSKSSMVNPEDAAPELQDKIKAAFVARVKDDQNSRRISKRSQLSISSHEAQKYIIAIGASTGGTEAVSEIIAALPDYMPPIVTVIHIPPIFSHAYAERLDSITNLKVSEVQGQEVLEPGHVYVGQGGKHVKAIDHGGKIRLKLTDDPIMSGFRPSVDYLFQSLAQIKSKRIVAVILTGMGRDGAKHMKTLHDKAHYTIAQDEKSCVVYGMPREAVEAGGVTDVLPLNKIPDAICNAIQGQTSKFKKSA